MSIPNSFYSRVGITIPASDLGEQRVSRAGANIEWTKELVARLRQCAADGMSAGQIAAELRGGLTRNANIGKAHRIGLQLTGRNRNNNPMGRNGRPRAKPGAQARVWPRTIVPPQERADAPRPIPPAPNSQPVDIMGLTNLTCRWPIGDPEPVQMFCGALEADNANGCPYCPHHAAAAVNRRGLG